MLPVPPPITTYSGPQLASEGSAPGSWQRELAGAVRSTEDLLRRLNLLQPLETLHHAAERLGLLEGSSGPSNVETASSQAISSERVAELLRRFPVLVPENFLSRMRPGDFADPLLRQVLPLAPEALLADGFVSDAVGDLSARRASGVLQKYAGRVLLIAASACAIHCRYCFRRDYPYETEPRRLEEWQPALDQIAADTTISEVIFSGGDPWMLSDHRLSQLCSAVDAIPHIERIRFHTRLPIVLPARVTAGLLALLTNLRAQPIVVVHANHGNEIVGDCLISLRQMVRSGIPVLNQSVLLAGINDHVEALETLSRRLINIGVMPYYLHQLDQVTGTSHFEVSTSTGQRLIQELATRLPGYAVPRYVQEIPGEPGKTPV
jgi:EF-P beta-lysylation protein EpmB